MLNFLDRKTIDKFLPVLIFLFAFSLRVYGINWDQNQHLHPDERFLTMTVDAMVWPKTFYEYINPTISKLNPYNIGTGFYVYGTFPTTFVKYFSKFELFDLFQYNNITLTGRFISSLFDVGVVFLVFLLTKNIINRKTAFLAGFLYSISVLPIQLSHFFTVDTFLNFFIVLSFYFLIKLISTQNCRFSVLLGLSYGVALACKISALYFLPVIIFGYFIYLLKYRNTLITTYCILFTTFSAYLSLRIFDIHIFSGNVISPEISPQFIQNIKELKTMGVRGSVFPPAIQWYEITPIIFPFKNIILWGLGLPLGILSIFANMYGLFVFLKGLLEIKNHKRLTSFYNHTKVKHWIHILIFFWILFLFFYQGIQYTPSMRYFLPIYPFLAILSANFTVSCIFPLFKKSHILYSIFFILILLWPISFLSVYSRLHSRVIASEWIYQNIPPGSTLSCDVWDDCLPLNIDGVGYASQYIIIGMEPFAEDTPQKQSRFQEQLGNLDYLVLSSNRAWGSITKVPTMYPFMAQFYKDLFADKLNFEKAAEITSYPKLKFGTWKLKIRDDSAEESFTVYDHPKIIIYKKIVNSSLP